MNVCDQTLCWVSGRVASSYAKICRIDAARHTSALVKVRVDRRRRWARIFARDAQRPTWRGDSLPRSPTSAERGRGATPIREPIRAGCKLASKSFLSSLVASGAGRSAGKSWRNDAGTDHTDFARVARLCCASVRNLRFAVPKFREHQKLSVFKRFRWCCKRGLNSRPLPYQGSALPLSYCSI